MSTAAPMSAQDHAATFTKEHRTIALVVVAMAFVMDLLDGTIVNVAIPSIQSNLGASYATIQWLVAGYALSFAVLLVTGGRMGDVFGYKKLFMTGVAGFTVASLLSGLAWSPAVLIAMRLVQGAMAALMVPQVMSLMQIMYKPEERAAVNGLFGALGGLSASLGPIIGGLLIKANVAGLDWRPIFLINVPVGIFAFLAAIRYLPSGKSAHPLKLDLTGTGLLVAALLLLVYPLIQGRDLGWPAWTFAMMAASLPVLAAFTWWQRRKMALDGSPLVIPSFFRKPSFSLGLLINVIFEGAMLSFFLTFTLLLQAGFGYTPIHSALTGIPTAVGIALCMVLLGHTIVPKLGRYAVTIGTSVMALGLLLTTYIAGHYGMSVHSWQFIPSLLVTGVGMGMVFGSLFAVVVNDIDIKHAGSVSGVLNAMQQVGGAIGIALIGVMFFGQLSSGAGASFASVEPQLRADLTAQHLPAVAQDKIVQGISTCFADMAKAKDPSDKPASCKQDGGEAQLAQNAKLVDAITHSAKQANAANFVGAFQRGIAFAMSLLGLTFVLSFFLPAHIRKEAFEEQV